MIKMKGMRSYIVVLIVVVGFQLFAHFVEGTMVCPFGGFFPDLMGEADIVEVPFEDRSILPKTITPAIRAEAKMARNDLLLPEG